MHVNDTLVNVGLTSARGLLWTALSFAVYVAALFATLPILAVAQSFTCRTWSRWPHGRWCGAGCR